jgi:DNA-binding transcriptional MerR regulator
MFHIAQTIFLGISLLFHQHSRASEQTPHFSLSALPPISSIATEPLDSNSFFTPTPSYEHWEEPTAQNQRFSVVHMPLSSSIEGSSPSSNFSQEIIDALNNTSFHLRKIEEAIERDDDLLSQTQEMLVTIFNERRRLTAEAQSIKQKLNDLQSHFQYEQCGKEFLKKQTDLLNEFHNRMTTLQRKMPQASSSSSGSSFQSSDAEETESDEERDYSSDYSDCSSDEDSDEHHENILPWKEMQKKICRMSQKNAIAALIEHIASLKGCTSDEDLNNYNSACLKRTGLYISQYQKDKLTAEKLQSSLNDINPNLLRTSAIGIYNKYKEYISSINNKSTKRQRTS